MDAPKNSFATVEDLAAHLRYVHEIEFPSAQACDVWAGGSEDCPLCTPERGSTP
jgi:hypothetical protein